MFTCDFDLCNYEEQETSFRIVFSRCFTATPPPCYRVRTGVFICKNRSFYTLYIGLLTLENYDIFPETISIKQGEILIMKNIFIFILAVLSLCSVLYAEPVLNNDLEKFKTEIEKSIKNSVTEREKKQSTELIFAAIDGDLKKVQNLWEQGVNLNATDEFGDTALIKASSGGHTDVVSFLVEKEADPNIQGLIGNTALMNAIIFEYVDIVRILAPITNLKIKNDFGETARTLAKRKSNQEIINIFYEVKKKERRKTWWFRLGKNSLEGAAAEGQIDK